VHPVYHCFHRFSDNGRGIDIEEHGQDLFKPFKRFHREKEGMGVGLYVIKYMVAKNGGHIEVDSKVGEGTSFNIFLKPYEIIAKREMAEEA
jgi:sigma-B regulation protein RsbU (phosphoserine phosphatase)